MMNNYFNIALVLSIGIHLILLGGLPFNLIRSKKEPSRQPKIEFIKIQEQKSIRLAKETSFKKPPPYLDIKKELLNIEKTNEPLFKKPVAKSSLINAKEVVFLKSKEALDSLPAYINYYEKIREKVRSAAYTNFNSAVSGRIFLHFTLDNSGSLINIYLDENTSSNSGMLKRIAKISVESSSPFPKFPKELNHFKTLTFNLSIHFKTN